jgi:hypothetical protein
VFILLGIALSYSWDVHHKLNISMNLCFNDISSVFLQIYKFEEISKLRDLALFKQVLLPNNCIHQLLPAEKKIEIQLWPRGHNYVLPFCKYVYFRHSFLNRCLYNYV